MTDHQSNIYPFPQDKYGLLARWQELKVPTLLEQLEKILTEHKCQTVLDYTDGNDLYANGLMEHGWQVTTPNGTQEDEKFDAVICMDNNLLQYKNTYDVIDILHSMLNRASENGVLVFCLPEVEEIITGHVEKEIMPLLLRYEYGGIRGSVIRYRCEGVEDDEMLVDYIYYMENLATGALTVDWEETRCACYCAETFIAFIESADGYNQKHLLVGDDRMFVSQNKPYIGPTSVIKRFPKVYDDVKFL